MPWLVAFIFGLLHGFGFAGALAEIGLPQNATPLALLSFNLGVELGQLLVVCIAILLLNLCKLISQALHNFLNAFCAYLLGTVATFWLLQRLFS